MSAAHNIKETLIEYYSLEMHDSLKNTTVTAQELVENTFMFDEDAMSSPSSEASIYLGERPSFIASKGMEVYGGQREIHEMLATLPQNKALLQQVVSLFDGELENMRPGEKITEDTLEKKAKAIVLLRANKQIRDITESRAKALESRGNSTAHWRKVENQVFMVILSNFVDDRKADFLQETEFSFAFHQTFEEFTNILQLKTVHPPHDLNAEYKPSSPRRPFFFSRSEAELFLGNGYWSRTKSVASTDTQDAWEDPSKWPPLTLPPSGISKSESDDEVGYTLDDGPWICRTQKVDGSFSAEYLITGREDFTKMVNFLKKLLMDHEGIRLTVKIIHLQDLIKSWEWMKQARKYENTYGEMLEGEDGFKE